MGDSELVSQLKRLHGNAQRELLVKTIQQSLQRILSTPDAPETDRPLIEMGLDSLMAVEFGTELQQMLGDQFAVGPTMLFDHPTIDAISDHVLELVAQSIERGAERRTPREIAAATESQARGVRDDVAIIGMSCRFPGARDVDEFWQNLLNGVDSVCEIPADRWDVDRFYSADREPGKMYTREGGFLDDIADFDAAFFNISDQEACWIDPQHRMLLENSYRALEDAGISPHPLADANVGVFMGIMGQDYAFLPTLDDHRRDQGVSGSRAFSQRGRRPDQLRVWFRRSERRGRYGQQQFAGRAVPGRAQFARRQLQSGVGRRRQCDPGSRQFTVDVEGRFAFSGRPLQIVLRRCRRVWSRRRLRRRCLETAQ